MTKKTSPSRRPPPDRPAWASLPPTGRCASSRPCLPTAPGRSIGLGREGLRCLLARRGVTFQRISAWKESTDPDYDTKLDRIEYLLEHAPGRVFAFDQFGPLGIRPSAGTGWARAGHPDRLPAAYHRTHVMDNVSAHKGARFRIRAKRHQVELCFTPTNSNHPNHTVQTRALQAYLRWRNTHARHPDVLAAQRALR